MSVAAALMRHALVLAEAAESNRGLGASECGRLSQCLFNLTLLSREMEALVPLRGAAEEGRRAALLRVPGEVRDEAA